MSNRLINLAAIFVIVAIFVQTLVIGRSILLPFLCAIVIWYFTLVVADFYQQILFQKLGRSTSLSLLFAVATMILILYGIIIMLGYSINQIIKDAPAYQSRISYIFQWVTSVSHQKVNLVSMLGKINFTGILTDIAYNLTSFASQILVIIVYVLFLFAEYKGFGIKLRAMCQTEEKFRRTEKIIERIKRDINTYVKIKTAMSFLTAVVSYIALISFQIKYAELWATLIFLLNYIPTIGSIIAVFITLLSISIQVTSLWMMLSIAFVLITIQFLIGNFVETKYLKQHLNLSPIVILFSLAFWGSIWGTIGLFLSVPVMTIITIILSQFKETKIIAILLSGSGEPLNPSSAVNK